MNGVGGTLGGGAPAALARPSSNLCFTFGNTPQEGAVELTLAMTGALRAAARKAGHPALLQVANG